MKPIRHILTAGIAAALFTCTASALTLPVSEDTSTSSVPALAKVAGRDSSLTVSDSRQGLIRFEAGAFAESLADAGTARLIIYLNKVTAPGALTVHRITEEWSEGGATAPAYDATPIATIPAASVVAKQYVIIDVTATVQAWLNEPGKDFGFAIAGSGGAQVLIGAKEGPGTGYPAELQIESGGIAFTDDDEDTASGHTRASATSPIGAFVTNADIKSNTIKGKKLAANSVDGSKLIFGSVTGAQIADGTISSLNISDGTITNADLAAGFTFPATTVADGSITTAKLANGAVTTAKLNLLTGNVGIGTANPTSNLSIRTNTTDASATATLSLIANGAHEWRMQSVTGFAAQTPVAAFQLVNVTTNTTALTASPNGSIGIGTGTPIGQLEVSSDTETDIFATAYSGVGGDPNFIGRRARGTAAAPTAVQTGDNLCFFGGRGYGDTAFADFSSAAMIFGAAENHTDTARGSSIIFQTTPNGTTTRLSQMTIDQSGNVGIGTTTPTQGKLVVSGSIVNLPVNSAITGLAFNGQFSTGTPVAESVSIFASSSIWSGQNLIASSDARIKTIQGHSDRAADLQKLLGIEITDYLYKDAANKGSTPQKKVIAQQVERVFPQAVSLHTDVVPDIYTSAPEQDGWVTLATDLKVGERVRLVGEDREETTQPVTEIKDGAFRTDFQPAGEKVFVYGREVGDFRTVDYDAIAMLNVSATQELHREIAALREKVAVLEAKDKARDARLTRLESALDQGAARTVRASLVK